MRGKRAKQYRKLMNQYALTFGFRKPYQVLGQSLVALLNPTTDKALQSMRKWFRMQQHTLWT